MGDRQSQEAPGHGRGKVGSDGKNLTADGNSKIWMVSNPETLSGIDGRHVKVKAFVDVG